MWMERLPRPHLLLVADLHHLPSAAVERFGQAQKHREAGAFTPRSRLLINGSFGYLARKNGTAVDDVRVLEDVACAHADERTSRDPAQLFHHRLDRLFHPL